VSILNDADKPSLEELMHHGVKGMKWGHRKNKPTTSDIKDARIRTRAREANLASATNRLNLATHAPASEQKAAVRNYQKVQMEFLKNPDRAVAMRLTTGEKFVLAALGPVGLAAGTGQVAARKLTERSVKKFNQ
jgi:hypothetical protein